MTSPVDWHQEGKATFQIGNAFYRPHSQLGRDLAVLAAALHKTDIGRLRVLDAMSGCGVRALRYALEARADWVWANEGNADVGPVLHQNLASQLEPDRFRVTHQDASCIFFECHQQRDYYDLVDVDSFGCATPYVNTGLWAVKLGGLIYLTDTDGRTSSGHNATKCLVSYGAYPRSHPAVHEQGLRLLIGSVWQQAASRGFGIQPAFSLFSGNIHRVMVRLLPKFDGNIQPYGFLGYCHHCGHYQTVGWRRLSRAQCPNHEVPKPLTLSGPMWLGPLHDRALLQRMIQLAQNWHRTDLVPLLQVMQAEADLPPYFFPLGEIGRWSKHNIPPRDRLIQVLQEKGYRVSPTHMDAQAIKTDAPFAECVAIARQLSSRQDF